jgi:N-methylhydantoinase A
VREAFVPRDLCLVAYCAARPLVLPAEMELLHVKLVVIPPNPGNFSALGLLSTDQVYSDSRSNYVVLSPDVAPQIAALYEEMESGLRRRVGDADGVSIRRSFDGRLYGQSWETPFIPVPDGEITGETIEGMIAAFTEEYGKRYGNTFPIPVQGVTYRVELVVEADKVDYVADVSGPPADAPQPNRSVELRHYADEPLQSGEYTRSELPTGASVTGPAIIREGLSTTFVCPGQVATVGPFGELIIRRQENGASFARAGENVGRASVLGAQGGMDR